MPPEEGYGNVVHRTRTKQATSPVKVEVIDIESETSMQIAEPDTQKKKINLARITKVSDLVSC